MAGDYTRFRYDPLNDTSGVRMQQGRVLLDQDWNEYVQLQDRRWRSETMDIMGRAVVPMDTPTAFEILTAGTSFTIGIGRMYVDGLQPENHGIDPRDPTKRKYDPILGELIGTSPIPYEQQPYFQIPAPPPLPTDNNPHLVYLDVWERELTYLEDPGLIDQAVAVDTGTRLQTVWQVKVLTNSIGVSCSTDPYIVFPPSAGRLTTAAAGIPASTDPCIVPANGGYRGSGNRCYRVEIHTGGPMGTAQFKWSRDNASVATPVTGVNASRDTLTVVLTKRDSVLRFQPGDWVEVTDDFRYFAGLPGEMRQIAIVDDVNLTLQLKTPLPAGEFDATNAKRHTRVVRWDQKGIVRDPLGNQIVDVDSNGGLIPVPAAGTTIVLEDGIQITFSIDTGIPVGNFHPLDYWMFDARVVDASIEILTQAPPRGIQHHYAWLATITFPSGPANNCRVFWPPAGGESCDCTVCVTADGHNGGTSTLQSAVNKVGATGGKICLAPGIYFIDTPVVISSVNNIEISGHGLPSLVARKLPAEQPIFQIDGCLDISMEDISFLGPAAAANQQPVAGLAISNSLFTRITRCAFTGFLPSTPGAAGTLSTMSLAVSLSGVIWDLQVRDCLFTNVQVGIGPAISEGTQAPFVAFSSIQNNEMGCIAAGLQFDDAKLGAIFLGVSFAENVVTAPLGFQSGRQGLDIAIERNTFVVSATPGASGLNVAPPNAAIVCAGSQVLISNNQIFGAGANNQGTDGIVLDGRFMYGIQVTGNRVDGLAGHGILVKQRTLVQEIMIAENQLLALGGAGILMEQGSFAVDMNIIGNSMTLVGLTSGVDVAFKELPIMAGILLLATMINVNVNENTIQGVGPDAKASASRAGVELFAVIDFRATGNRIADIGPATGINPSAGVVVLASAGRVHIVDNEIRRASLPPANGDSSWSAITIFVAVGDMAIRGNILESFGTAPTVVVVFALSCVFTDNQCFLDNAVTQALPNPNVLAVLLGLNESLRAGAIIASNNLVRTPVLSASATSQSPEVVLLNPGLNPTDKKPAVTVIGNITTGPIRVLGQALNAPWNGLNVLNV